MYDINELLDARNRPLHEVISAQIPVVLEESDDEYWGEKIRDGKAVISVATSDYPTSCFTHELLHVEQDLAGRQRPGCAHEAESEASYAQQNNVISDLLPYAYNHLIHHKTFPRFLKLGFPAEQFLLAENADDRKRVIGDVERLNANKTQYLYGVPFGILVYPYLWASSPEDNSKEAADLLKKIRNLAASNSFYDANKLLNALRKDDAPDMRRYLGRLFNICGLPNVAFGPDENNLIWARDCQEI